MSNRIRRGSGTYLSHSEEGWIFADEGIGTTLGNDVFAWYIAIKDLVFNSDAVTASLSAANIRVPRQCKIISKSAGSAAQKLPGLFRGH